MLFGLEIEIAAVDEKELPGKTFVEAENRDMAKAMAQEKGDQVRIIPNIEITDRMYKDWSRTVEEAKQAGVLRQDNNSEYYWRVRQELNFEQFETITPVLGNTTKDWEELEQAFYLLRGQASDWQMRGYKAVIKIHFHVGGYPLDARTRQDLSFIFKAMEYAWTEMVGVERIKGSSDGVKGPGVLRMDALFGKPLEHRHEEDILAQKSASVTVEKGQHRSHLGAVAVLDRKNKIVRKGEIRS